MTVTNVRVIGLAAGLLVGALFDVVGAGAASGGPGVVPPFGVAVVVAGGLGGWLLAPSASRARTLAQWLGVVLALALVAVLIGDAVVVASIVLGDLGAGDASDPGSVLGQLVGLYLLGLLFVGPAAYVGAAVAGGVWALLMWWLRRLTEEPDSRAVT